MKKILLIIWNLKIKFNIKTKSLFGKLLPLSYILNEKEIVDVNKISSTLYINGRYVKNYPTEVINQNKIFVETHTFLMKTSYKNDTMFYITFNTKLKKLDLIINLNFFKLK